MFYVYQRYAIEYVIKRKRKYVLRANVKKIILKDYR